MKKKQKSQPYYILNPERSYEFSIPKSLERPNTQANKVAIVSGAGPAGLMSAIILKLKGTDEVVVVESREFYNRMNFINFEKDALRLLKELDLLKDFSDRAIFVYKNKGNEDPFVVICKNQTCSNKISGINEINAYLRDHKITHDSK